MPLTLAQAWRFVVFNFIVSFISDVVLNDLSRMMPSSTIIGSLRPYFEGQSIVLAGAAAGATILAALLPTMAATRLIFGTWEPGSVAGLARLCAVGFFVGFALDVVIEKWRIFGARLEPYYKLAGSGFWGAAAFVFSMVFSYLVEKILFC